ncbi:MAG: hypothetical protein LBL74_01590 [Bacteroidales bacterium]|jgi:hypothetical protein|nr:hypothetical protein [Bacteroidales bacterium]
MKKKFIQFVLLIAFMMLLNLIGHLIGISFVKEYIEYGGKYYYPFRMLFLICIYSFFQIFVFPIHKKYRIFIIPIFILLLFSLMVFDDPTGFGREIVNDTISLVSRIIYVIYYIIAYNITNLETRIIFLNLLYSVGYSLYLLGVFASFKYIMKYLGSKYSFFAVTNSQQITQQKEKK